MTQNPLIEKNSENIPSPEVDSHSDGTEEESSSLKQVSRRGSNFDVGDVYENDQDRAGQSPNSAESQVLLDVPSSDEVDDVKIPTHKPSNPLMKKRSHHGQSQVSSTSNDIPSVEERDKHETKEGESEGKGEEAQVIGTSEDDSPPPPDTPSLEQADVVGNRRGSCFDVDAVYLSPDDEAKKVKEKEEQEKADQQAKQEAKVARQTLVRAEMDEYKAKLAQLEAKLAAVVNEAKEAKEAKRRSRKISRSMSIKWVSDAEHVKCMTSNCDVTFGALSRR